MISCKLSGGLGNYMFQVGAACSLAHSNNDVAIFDLNTTLQIHNSFSTYTSNIFAKVQLGSFIPKHFHNEPNDFSYKKIPYMNQLHLQGYFQSEKYLNRDYILDLFSIDVESLKYIETKYSSILQEKTVSLHIRRGNYLERQSKHPIQPISYFTNSFNEFPTNSLFLVFSDDIEWCKNNLKGKNIKFIEGEEDYIDLYLMSLCKNNIIANSSFSWWGAYLNKNHSKKVISPKMWFGPDKHLKTDNIYCKNWIKL